MHQAEASEILPALIGGFSSRGVARKVDGARIGWFCLGRMFLAWTVVVNKQSVDPGGRSQVG